MKKITKTAFVGLLLWATAFCANAQQDWGCTEDIRETILEDASVYQSSMKFFIETHDTRYLEDAYPHWKVVIGNCPKQSKNLYTNGEIIVRLLIAKESNQQKRKELLNSLLAMYDKQMIIYPDEKSEILALRNQAIEQYGKDSRSTSDEWEREYSQLIREQLAKGNCTSAKAFYDIYKTLLKHGDKAIDKSLADCNGGIYTDPDEQYIRDWSEKLEKEDVVLIPDVNPEFPGGDEAMMQFLAENIHYPDTAKEYGITGKVYIKFVIEKDGTVSNINVIRDIGGGCGEETKRVVAIMPRWRPGKVGGRNVRSQFILPFNFELK